MTNCTRSNGGAILDASPNKMRDPITSRTSESGTTDRAMIGKSCRSVLDRARCLHVDNIDTQ